jgi:hypothetical protein
VFSALIISRPHDDSLHHLDVIRACAWSGFKNRGKADC